METLISAIRIAIAAIFTNKTRSFLTMLGIVIGVSSVIMLTSIGVGLQKYIVDQFSSLGAETITILPGDIFGTSGSSLGASGASSAFITNKLRLRDSDAIKKLRDHITDVAPAFEATAIVSYAQKKQASQILGTTPSYVSITDTKQTKGRFFSIEEYQNNRRVVVLGPEVVKKIFGDIDPIGKKVKVGTETFTVVGVNEAMGGGMAGASIDTHSYVPLAVAQRQFGSDSIMTILAKARSKEEIPVAIEDIKKELLKRLKKDDFSVIDQKEFLKTIDQILGVLTVGLGGIAAISLVVGGIGILNIMLVSVIERTREIGLRKALGATPNIILAQFLIEAATLSLFGGMIGSLLAYLATLAVHPFFPAVVTPGAVMLAFGVSAAIGIVFGVVPARQASKLSPIEALRYE